MRESPHRKFADRLIVFKIPMVANLKPASTRAKPCNGITHKG